MRRALATVLQGILATLAVALVWVPPLLIVGWGILAVINLARLALAPGVPVRIPYVANDGTAEVVVESYLVDPLRRRARLTGVRVIAPNGDLVASVDQAWVAQRAGVWDVRVHALAANLRREPGGTYSFERALPPKGEPGPPVPWTAQVDGVHVRYVDATQLPELPLTLTAQNLRLAGLSGQVLAEGGIMVVGAGPLRLDLQVLEAGWHARVRPSELDATSLLPHARRWLAKELLQPLEPFRSDQLRISGDVGVGLPQDGSLEYQGNIGFHAVNLTVAEWIRRGTAHGTIGFGVGAAQIEARLVEPNRQGSFTGRIGWGDQTQVVGRVSLRVDRRADLWPIVARAAGRGWDAQGLAVDGNVVYAGGRASGQGTVSVDRLVAARETFRGLRADVSLVQGAGQAKLLEGTWGTTPLTAGLTWQLGGAVRGFAEANNVALAPVLARAGVQVPLTGTLGRVQLVVEGTVDRPVARARVAGALAYRPERQPGLFLGALALNLRADRERVTLERLALTGPNGALAVRGQYHIKSEKLNLFAEGGGFRLQALDPDWRGSVFADLAVRGTLRKPIVTGPVAVYGAGAGDFRWPVLLGQLEFRNGVVAARDLRGESAVSRVKGEVRFDPATRRLGGELAATDLQLADLVPGTLAGEVDVTRLVLGGTTQRPQVQAGLSSEAVLIGGTSLTNATASLRLVGDTVTLERLNAQLGEGTVFARGEGNWRTESGAGRIVLQQVPIDRVARDEVPVTLSGAITAVADASYDPRRRWQAQVRSEVNEFRVNGSLLGTGPFEAQLAGDTLTATLAIGTKDRFLATDNVRVNLKDRTISGRAEVGNYPLTDLLAAYTAAADVDPASLDPRLLDLTGALGLSVAVNGAWDDPAVEVEQVQLEDLTLGTESAGRFQGKATRAPGGQWTVAEARWALADSSARVRGSVTESGGLDLNLDAENLRGTWLPLLDPTWPSVPLETDIALVASGTVDAPIVLGSVNAESLAETTTGLGEPGRKPSLSLFPVEYRDDRLTLEGQFYAEGFTGAVQAGIPRSALRANPDPDAVVTASIDLRDRDLADIAAAVDAIDRTQTRGVLGGKLELTGTLRDPELVGGIRLRDGLIKFKNSQTTLTQVNAELRPVGRALEVTASTAGSAGGNAQLAMRVDMARFLDGELTGERLRETVAVEGSLDGVAWSVNEAILGNPNERVVGRVDRVALKAAGALANPQVTGEVVLGPMSVRIPSEFAEGEPREAPPVNPRFANVRLVAGGPLSVQNEVIRVVLRGGGTLAGTLAFPDFQSDLVVQGGLFLLPNARIVLEPGGTVALKYASGEFLEGNTRLDIDVEGRTTVSATRGGTVPDRYDVVLQLRGDLLSPNGITFDASSDPPDLSKDEILAILGQRDLVQTLADQVSGGSRTPVSQALFRLALPNLSAPLTREIASVLQLDFIGLEYDAFAGPMLLAGETIARGLTVTARRQLGPSINGRQYYDLRLSYRVPSRNPVLSRFRIGLMTDQDRPWRLTLDYTVRF